MKDRNKITRDIKETSRSKGTQGVMPRMLVVATTPLCMDGLTAVLLRMAEIAKQYFQVDFALGEGAEDSVSEKLKEIGIAYLLPNRSRKTLKYIRFLSRVVKSGSYTAVYIHGNSGTMAVDLIGAKLGGATVRITHCHNWAKQPALKRLTLGTLMNHLATHPVSCGMKAGEALYSGSFTLIPNGVDTKKFKFSQMTREEQRDNLNISDCFAVGHIGRFTKQKNHERLLRIFREVRKIREDAVLMLCGTGELLQEVKEQAKDLGEAVRFCGSVAKPQNYMMAMDVFVLPSFFEGFPLVGVEAQTCGLPCVFSDAITREVAVAPNVEYLSLEEDDRMWAKTICNMKCKDRDSAAERIAAAGYDIETMRKRAEEFLSSL